jgi:hypothetical protein
MIGRPTDDQISNLADFLYGPPPESAGVSMGGSTPPWEPSLNPTQYKAYKDRAKYILMYGERASGKSIGALHMLVEHCYENQNALAVIIVGVKRQAEEGGAWHKLITMVLPEWKAGKGLDYTSEKTNVAKDKFIWISNRHGGWSRVLLLSMPVGAFVADRVKGIEASFVFVDEAQTLEGDENGQSPYFNALIQQVGRIAGIPYQQVVYCANPAGPSHWLYKRFFIAAINPDTQERDPAYSVYHVPISENIKNLPPGYYETVMEATRGDDIEYRRMVLGEWVDRPDAAALFVDDWNAQRHVKGDPIRGDQLMPLPGHDIFVGWDPGAAHSSIHMQQLIPTTEKSVWVVFDEVNRVDCYTAYIDLVPMVIRRMQVWCEIMRYPFKFVHISDSSAFDQYRASSGSFDAQDIERISRQYVTEQKLDERFIIRMRACPKASGSVEARVRGTKDRLRNDELFVSCTCVKTLSMFMLLEEDPEDRLHPKRSQHIHVFDSLTYPHLYVQAKGGMRRSRHKPQYYSVH